MSFTSGIPSHCDRGDNEGSQSFNCTAGTRSGVLTTLKGGSAGAGRGGSDKASLNEEDDN